MSIQINKSAYEKLIKEDIEWLLSNTKDSLERRHIVEVLNYSLEWLYASGSSETQKDLEDASMIYGLSVPCEYPPVIDAEGGEHPVFDLTAIEDAFKAGWLAHVEKSEKPNVTNWEQIEKRAKVSEKALDYMREHPLTHEQAVEQTRRLKEGEKPTSAEGLEEEIEDFKKKIGCPVYWCSDDEQVEWLSIVARHFAKLGAEHAKKDEIPVSDDLEEAALKFADREYMVGDVDRSALYKGFWHGGKWQKEQMMKGAVEASVGRNFTGVQEISFTVYPDKYKDGDKVKLIIVKED